jgi:hypothetical protein
MEIAKPRIGADIEQRLSFDEATGVLSVGWTARPSVNLGSSLSFKLSAAEARSLGAALSAFAAQAKP